MRRIALAPIAAILLVFSQTADAAITITAVEIGGDVVFTYSGTLDLTGTTFTTTATGGLSGTFAGIDYIQSDGTKDFYDTTVTSSGDFSTVITDVDGNTSTGDPFRISTFATSDIGVPVGYVSLDPISGSVTLVGHTFTSLGLAASGTHTWSWGAGTPDQTVTLTWGAVPEPSSYALAMLCLLGLGIRRRFAA